MAIPGVRVRFAFGVNPGDGEPALSAWVDVSEYVRSIATRVGRSQDLDRQEAGTAIIELDNSDARFTPDNTGSEHYGDMRPFTPVEISWVSDEFLPAPFQLGAARLGTAAGATIYDTPPTSAVFFRGLVETWRLTWFHPRGGTATINVVDLFRWIALRTVTTGGTEQTVGARIDSILSSIGSPFPQEIDSTGLTLAALSPSSVNALQYCQDIASLDGGLFYSRGDGKIVYQSRASLAGAATYSSVQAQIGDQAPEIPYKTINYGLDEQLITNVVDGAYYNTATTSHVALATVSDAVSSGYYLSRPKDFGDTGVTSSTGLQNRMVLELVNKSTARLRVEDLSFEIRDTNVDSITLVSLDVMHRVSITRRPDQGDALTGEFLVQSIQHDITPDRWTMRLGVSLAPSAWELGVGKLGTTALLRF